MTKNLFLRGSKVDTDPKNVTDETQENSEESFIRETIKKKPLNKKKIAIKIVSVAALAVLAGVIAAFVFVKMVPVAQKAMGMEEETPRVTLAPADTSTPTPTPAETPTPAPTETPQPTPTAEPQQDVTPEPTKVVETIVQSLTPTEYNALYREMLAATEDTQKSIVSVIGITSQMDYFNQSYESQQQVSGLIIAQTDADIYILTQYSVLENVERIQVALTADYITDGIFQKNDPVTGMAVVKINSEGIPDEVLEQIKTAPIGNSDSVRQGDIVIALGSPSGSSNYAVFGNVTSLSGVYSDFDTEYSLISTDIYGTSEGNGILVDLRGRIIGLIFSASETSANTVSAIPISSVKDLLEKLSNNESRSYVGIKGREVTSYTADRTGIPRGVLITEIASDSPAFLAGLTEADVIVQIGEERITDMKQLSEIVSGLEINDTVTIIAARRGAEGYSEMEFQLKIGEI